MLSINDKDDVLVKGDDGTEDGKKIGVVSDRLKVDLTNQIISLSAGTLSTYSASISGLVCAAAATDIFTITGSASKTVRILAVAVSGTTSAGSGKSVGMSLIKRSSSNSSGTSTTPTIVAYDSSNSVGTAVVRAYTANPTLGTSVGAVVAQKIAIPTVGAGGYGSSLSFYEFGSRPAQAIVLRGTNQQLCVNFGADTITNPLISITIEWTEE